MNVFYLKYKPINWFVIVDVDGTFTWSDLLGHFFSVFNISYIHNNIIELLNKI